MNQLPKHNIFSHKYFGLSIGQNSIRIVTLNSDKSLGSQFEVNVPPEVFGKDNIKPQPLIDALSQIITSSKLPTNFAAITIPDIYSYSRLYILPKIDLGEVTEAINWQIEKIFPLPKDQIYFDWKLINQDDKQLIILVVALHKQFLDDLVSVLEKVNIRPISFEPSASALSRIVPPDPQHPSYALVEINQFGISTTLIGNSISLLTVTHKFDQNQDSAAILQKINQSLEELTHFYSAKYNQSLENLQTYITGDSASAELVAWLNNYLTKKVKLLDINTIPAGFHSAYAAASTSVLPPSSQNSINLLPQKLQQVFDATLDMNQITSAIKTTLILLFFSLAVSAITFIFSLGQSVQYQNQLAGLEQDQTSLALDLQQTTSVNTVSASLIRLFPLKNSPLSYIHEILALTPDNITINNWTYSKETKKITLTGTAPSRNDFVNFREGLKESNLFSDVSSPLDAIQQPVNLEFSINLTLKST